MAGRGIMKNKNAIGNARTRNQSRPKMSSTSPASTTISEARCAYSSAPTEPMRSISNPNASSPTPQRLGTTGRACNFSRRSHTKYADSTGTRNPCE